MSVSMKLPNHGNVAVSKRKVTNYLLSDVHSNGRHKAVLFKRFGFTADRPDVLQAALQEHAKQHDVAKIEKSPFGTRYVIEGILMAPDGRTPMVRTIWFIELGQPMPRFMTAYPLKRGDDDS